MTTEEKGPANPNGFRRLCELHQDVDYRHEWGCPRCMEEARVLLRELFGTDDRIVVRGRYFNRPVGLAKPTVI